MLNQLLDEGFLQPLDLYFADMHKPCSLPERAFLAAVMQAARQGHLCLDLSSLEAPVGSFGLAWKEAVLAGASIASPYLVIENHCVYLKKNYHYETEVLNHLKKLLGPSLLPRVKANLTPEQQTAFDLVRSENLSIIEGGPGTGKTYLISELVKSFGPESQIILTAPTGKAAARLKEKNEHAICGTLHSILGIKSDRNWGNHQAFLQADLIVVDEASMIDAKMMMVLLKTLQAGQRIVFLGDGHQLPPVESGSLFNDLIDLIPTAHLRTCHRSDRREILELAQSILEGRPPVPTAPLSKEKIIEFARRQEGSRAILTPLREGPWGVKELNQIIDAALKVRGERTIPIIITRNDPETGLSNGDTGILITSSERPLYALIDSRRFSPAELPPYEMAYALSIHKSQGSEFDHVLVLAPEGTETFGCEVLYTAATRARESITLYGEQEVVAQTVLRSSCKRSGLKKRFLTTLSI